MTATFSHATRQIARAASTVMVAFFLSNLTGLLRQILVLQAFGTGMEMEAFNAANRVSETLFNLVAGGALASAFIPTFTGLLVKNNHRGAWKLASAIFNLTLLIISLGALVAAIFAPQIVRYVLAPGFSTDPIKEELAKELLLIMLPSAILFSCSGLVMGVLNSKQVFFLPALTPSLYQLGMIFGVLVLSPRIGIHGLAWGVVIGAGLHLGVQLPKLINQKLIYYPILGINLPEVREVARLMAPRLLGVAVVQLNFWVNTRLASLQPEGSVTGIVVAFTLMLMPQAAIAQSIAIAALPTLSSQFALNKINDFRRTLEASVRGVIFLSMPASIGLILLRKPIIELLYKRGEFNELSTQLVAWALLWYAVGLVGHCLVEILARAFYAMHDTRTPVLVGIAAMSLNVVFSIWFSQFFWTLGWLPHGGLALANSLATGLEALGLIYLMHKKLNGFEGKKIFLGVIKAGIGTVLMAIGLLGWLTFLHNRSNWLVALGGVGIGGVVYFLALLFEDVPELKILIQWIRNIMGRFLRIS